MMNQSQSTFVNCLGIKKSKRRKIDKAFNINNYQVEKNIHFQGEIYGN